MSPENGRKGSNPDTGNNGAQRGLRPPVTFDEYLARLHPDVRAGLSRDALSMMKRRWQVHNRIGAIETVGQVNQGVDSSNKEDSRPSFDEYQRTKLARVTSKTGGVPRQVLQLVREHWTSGQWNAPSGTNPETD